MASMAGNEMSTGRSLPLITRLKQFTPKVLFMTFYLAVTAWNFGYDVSVFSGVQAMGPFVERFGSYDASIGAYAISSYIRSIMNSFPYLGKLLGCWVAQPTAERFGRRRSVIIIAITTFIGVILQISSSSTAQFTIGRCLCYAVTGFSVIVMPAFMAECAPAALRGMIGIQLQLQIVAAQVVAAAVNFGTSTISTDAGWRTSIGIQFIMPGLLLIFYPFVVESPRWLISQDRRADAASSLRRLHKRDYSEQLIQEELTILSHSDGNEGKGTWREVFTGTNRRRTAIACIAMIGQQLTGQAFVSQYSLIFYSEQGFENIFELGIIQQCVGLFAAICTASIVDGFGRRIILLLGGTSCATFLFIMGSMGALSDPSTTERRLLVASVMLWHFSYILSWASLPYVVLGETATRRVVEKTNNLAVSLSVISAFLVSFTVPYLVDPGYGNLGGKVGFVYGSLMVMFVVLTYFFVPEMKARSLEEIDILFQEQVPTRKFKIALITSTDPSAKNVEQKRNGDTKDASISISEL